MARTHFRLIWCFVEREREEIYLRPDIRCRKYCKKFVEDVVISILYLYILILQIRGHCCTLSLTLRHKDMETDHILVPKHMDFFIQYICQNK